MRGGGEERRRGVPLLFDKAVAKLWHGPISLSFPLVVIPSRSSVVVPLHSTASSTSLFTYSPSSSPISIHSPRASILHSLQNSLSHFISFRFAPFSLNPLFPFLHFIFFICDSLSTCFWNVYLCIMNRDLKSFFIYIIWTIIWITYRLTHAHTLWRRFGYFFCFFALLK